MGLAVTKVSSRRRGPMKDTSVRKRTKPALSKEYQVVFEKTGKAMVIVEEDATISLVNAEFEKLSGFTKEEIEGKKNWAEFVARDDRKRVKEYHLLRRTDPMLAPRSYEFRFLDRQEKVKNIILTIGQIPGTSKSMASLLDVTDRRQAEIAQNNSNGQEGGVQVHVKELEKANEALQAENADLKRKVKQLQESKELHQSLVENVDFGINLIDADHNIVMANNALIKRRNTSVEELIGEKCYRALEKRDAVCPQCPGVQAMATGLPASVETEGAEDDPHRFPARLQAFPVLREDGTESGFIEVVEDITERKQMELELRQSEERFRRFADEASFEGFIVHDKGKILDVNKIFATMYGYERDELIGMNISETIASEYRKTVSKSVREKDEEPYEIMSLRKDGSTFPVEIHAKPFPFNGRIVRVAAVRDMTERKQAEKLLQQEKETFYTMLQNALYGVGLIDSDGSYLYVNPEFTKITGYTLKDIPTGKDWMHKAYPDKEYRQKAIETWKKDIGVGGTSRVFSVVCKDGKTREIEFRPTQLDDGRAVVMFTDITERKQMEEELRQSEERFRRLVETMRVGLSAVDANGVITYVNDQVCKMLRYSADEVIGHPTTDFYDEESQRRQEEIFAKRKKGVKDPTPYEITWMAKDGRRVDTILTPTPSYDADGHFTSSFALFTDITERKQMEEELRKSQEELQTLMDASPIGICWADMQGNIQYNNRKFRELFGYTVEDIPNIAEWRCQAYPDPVYREQIPSLVGLLTEAQKQGKEAAPIEVAVTCKDGSTRHVMQAGGFASNRILAIYSDITERKQMEEELRESESRFRTLVETTKVGVSAMDEKGVITYVNDRWGEIWGYSLKEIMGRYIFDFLDEKNLQILKEQLAKRREGSRESYEITWTKKDGSKAPTILSPTPILDTDGRYKGSYDFITDITERKRAEEQLQRYAAELEQSNEEVKNFAYIVSHDLRVPLVNLKGYTSELSSALEVIGPTMETALPHLNEEKRSAVAIALHEDVPEALEFITNSVSRMDSFINSVLILSRLGRRELKSEPIDMNTLVQTSLETLSHQIQERGTKVTVGSLPEVVADRTAMEQIVGNVLGNAVKYLDPERSGQIEVTAQTNNGEQLFCISDNGRGIAEEDMHKVFAPFRRAGKQDTPGEGMGLAYVQTLVRRQDGRIWCESELGKGTTFTFTISQHRTEGEDHVAH